jgi:twinkle protein
MNLNEFADQYLYPYKRKGNEIVPEYCPFCFGGKNHDKHTFALNVEKGTYNCKRGKCNEKGTYNNLLNKFNIRRNNKMRTFDLESINKEYCKPVDNYLSINEKCAQYLLGRGISKNTIDSFSIKSDKEGNIVFPFYEDDKLVFVKYRIPGDIKKGFRKSWREKNTKPVLFGMQLCDTDKPLCMFEGEIDAMSGYESGIPNCVSVPSGANDLTWLDTCFDFMNKFEKVYLFIDNDEAGRTLVNNLTKKLTRQEIYVVKYDGKDANELLVSKGGDIVKDSYEKATEVPRFGIKSMSSIPPLDFSKVEMIPSGLPSLDRDMGGFIHGDVSVWTGKSGSGKSTMLGQILINAVHNDFNVCIYSGELSPDRVKYWMDLQIASSENIESVYFENLDKSYNTIPQDIQRKINEFYDKKVFIYDNFDMDEDSRDSIFKVFEYAYKRYNCRVFLVDNLMTAITPNSNISYYEQQSTFIGDLTKFAGTYNVHIHVVAHTRKTSGKVTSFDISGSADIINRAANVLSIERVFNTDNKLKLSVLKNRWEGIENEYWLEFCPECKRIFEPNCECKDYLDKKKNS